MDGKGWLYNRASDNDVGESVAVTIESGKRWAALTPPSSETEVARRIKVGVGVPQAVPRSEYACRWLWCQAGLYEGLGLAKCVQANGQCWSGNKHLPRWYLFEGSGDVA